MRGELESAFVGANNNSPLLITLPQPPPVRGRGVKWCFQLRSSTKSEMTAAKHYTLADPAREDLIEMVKFSEAEFCERQP